MPVQVSYPGVYVQEEPSGVQTITGVSTSIALFVGMAQRGPMDRATNLLSFTAYERTFGSDTTVSETTDQVRQFFLNGGSQAYVIRIADGAQAASVDLDNEAQAVVLRLTAAEAGRVGESIRVEVNYATAQPESTFNLVVSREIIDASGEPTLVETETIGELSMNPSAARFVETAVEQESRLIARRGAGYGHRLRRLFDERPGRGRLARRPEHAARDARRTRAAFRSAWTAVHRCRCC